MSLQLQQTIECTLPGIELLFGNVTTLKECINAESATNTYFKYSEITKNWMSNALLGDCHVPCFQKSYSQSVKHFHKTALVDLENSNGEVFYLSMAFSSLDVETRTETLVYDLGSFLAAAGGHLGLFLGFSCFTSIWALISMLEHYFGRK